MAQDSPTPHIQLADLFSRFGRELTGHRSIDTVLETITRRAFEAIPSAEHAAVSRGRAGNFETVAATSEVPPQVDKIQYELQAGPCVDAILDDTVFLVGDLKRTDRWPEFSRRAAEQCDIRSMLSVRMYLEGDDLLAGLNLYSSQVDAFDESDRTTAVLLATHGALAFAAASRQNKIDNLERALQTSRRIGIAIGILMATYKVTDEQGFDLLRIASQAKHRKLADIAEDVAETGDLELPSTPEIRRRGGILPATP